MKFKIEKTVLFANYVLLILYMSWRVKESTQLGVIVSLLIASIMLIDITYISACNIRENKVISLFCGLLVLDSWYILMSFDEKLIENIYFNALSPITLYASIKFILIFLFQEGGYKFRKATNITLFLTCMSALAGLCISSQVYACMYGIQFLVNITCFMFLVSYHWKRVAFVLKSEWKCILFSTIIVTVLFLSYYFVTMGIQDRLSNFGVYLPVLLFFMSVHGIALKENSSFPLSTVFSRKQIALILGLSIGILGLVIQFLNSGFEKFLILINVLFAIIYLCNVVLGQSLKHGRNKIMKESKYHAALLNLQQEELLKTEFSNFLHDDVLQDLLSIKNLTNKANRPDIQDIIIKTLDNLNTRIREQMQDYHPIILKNLTVKENYQNLIEIISQTFPRRNIVVSFDCPDTVFLVEPYNVLIYRLLKELLANVYKHSNGNRAWVTLTQENNIIKLSVSDDGNVDITQLTSIDKTKHKGIVSITEQVNSMGGAISISKNALHGVHIQIIIPMKGDISYQYFIS